MSLLQEKRLSTPTVFFDVKDGRFYAEIETPRLYIRSYNDEDFYDCLQLYGDKEITKHFDFGRPRTLHEVKELIVEKGLKYFSKAKPFGLFSVFEKDTMEFLGQVDFLPSEEPGTVEVGYIFHSRYHNQGYCTEAVKAIIFDYVYEVNFRYLTQRNKIQKIIATAHPKNYPSIKVLEKLGMSFYKFEDRFEKERLWFSLTLKDTAIHETSRIRIKK